VRAVLDPNVLVSAAISEQGVPAEILRRWEGGEFELVVSAEILFELSEVLRRPKFRRYLTEEEALAYVLRLHDHAAEVSQELPPNVVQGVTPDPDDDYLAGVAYLGQADVIVSGDRHLLDLPDKRIYYGIDGTIVRVLSPREFLEELRAGE
jgi:putative PIN family toxin of toxin-antitoxin system